MMLVDNKYHLGERVYLITDRAQEEGMVTGITLFPGGMHYHVSFGPDVGIHYELELTNEYDPAKNIS